jgi:predicted nucleic acid-binding protein
VNEVFGDAAYWVGVLLPNDSLHLASLNWKKSAGSTYRIVTTDLVLTEVLNHVSRLGQRARIMAGETWLDISTSPRVVLIPSSESLLRKSVDLYMSHGDKSWSLTDCASFIVMRERKIQDALTFDRHFEQAGFRALLRSE